MLTDRQTDRQTDGRTDRHANLIVGLVTRNPPNEIFLTTPPPLTQKNFQLHYFETSVFVLNIMAVYQSHYQVHVICHTEIRALKP